jgi:hypothetical protein
LRKNRGNPFELPLTEIVFVTEAGHFGALVYFKSSGLMLLPYWVLTGEEIAALAQ